MPRRENSGHIVCSDVTTTGDGIIAALRVLRALQADGRPLHLAKLAMQKMPQVMINVPMASKQNPMANASVQAAVAAAEQALGGDGRVLLRPSGTEPVVPRYGGRQTSRYGRAPLSRIS